MKITKKNLGNELLKQLDLGKNCNKIGAWAHAFYSNPNVDEELRGIINRLIAMDEGTEWECSEIHLRVLAEMLLNEEDHIEERFEDMIISNDIDAARANRSFVKISKSQLGEELLMLIDSRKSLIEISEWALEYFKKPGIEPELRDILSRLAIMSKVPDSECNEKELRFLANMLNANENQISEKLLALINERMSSEKKNKKKR